MLIISLGVIGPFQTLMIVALAALPIILLFFAIKAIINTVQKNASQQQTTVIIDQGHVANETKQCPFCGEEILLGAKKCKHCGEWLDTANQEDLIDQQ